MTVFDILKFLFENYFEANSSSAEEPLGELKEFLLQKIREHQESPKSSENLSLQEEFFSQPSENSFRAFHPIETDCLSPEALGLFITLENLGLLSVEEREHLMASLCHNLTPTASVSLEELKFFLLDSLSRKTALESNNSTFYRYYSRMKPR